MSKKDKTKVVHKRVVVKKSTSPYAPMLKLIYRTCIGITILVVVWMAYEAFNTARVGIQHHNQQQSDYRKAMGIKEKPKAEKPEQSEEETDPQTMDEDKQDEEGSGN